MPKRWLDDRGEIEGLLASAVVGRLGTCLDGRPYVVPLNYFYRDGRVYFHSRHGGRKLENLVANPRVCFEVDEVREVVRGETCSSYTCRYRSVIAEGEARIVEDPEEKRRLLDWLVSKYAVGRSVAPVDPEEAATCTVVEVELAEMTGKENYDGSD